MKTRTKKPLSGALAGLGHTTPFEQLPFTGTHCSECGAAQRMSHSGVTCQNGHGGAPALEETRAAVPGVVQPPNETGDLFAPGQIDPTTRRHAAAMVETVKVIPPKKKRPPINVAPPVALWTEDDATTRDPDHEDLDAAWRRMFGEKLDTADAVDTGSAPDATFYRMPNGATAIVSYPGASMIQCDAQDEARLRELIARNQTASPTGGTADSEHVSQAELDVALGALKRAAKRASKPSSGIGLQFVAVDTRDLIETEDPGALLKGPRLNHAIVKVSPSIKASERDAFDSVGIKARLLEHGAEAVMISPRIVADGGVKAEAKREAVKAASPEQAVREWFAGQTGLTADEIEEAIEVALDILGAS